MRWFMMPDKTAVSEPEPPKRLFWEKPRDERKAPKDVPFKSQLQQEVIRQQKESEPQSGHVEPQIFPPLWFFGGIKDVGKVSGLMKEDAKNLFKGMPKK